MSDGLVKKAGQSTQDFAQQVAKQASREPGEFLKSAKSQVYKTSEAQQLSAIPENIGSRDEKSIQQQAVQLEEESRKRIEELEGKLKKIREERERKKGEWSQEQEEKMASAVEEETKKLVEPATRPKRGFMGSAEIQKKKQGTQELGKGPTG